MLRSKIALASVLVGGAACFGPAGTASAATIAINSGNPVTATMDSGTTPEPAGSGANTWYAVGYNTSAPTTGLPSGATFTSATNSNISYKFASFASGNDALLLDGSSTGNVLSGTLTFATPVTALTNNFSILTSTGNGSGTLTLTLNLVGGTTFAVTPTVASPDWFNNTPVAYDANGRLDETGTFNNVNAGNPNLYDGIVATGYTGVLPIAGISVAFTPSANNSNTVIFGVSGSTSASGTYTPITLATSSFNQNIVATVPEPSVLGLLGLAGIGLLARRRRRCQHGK